MAKKSRRVRKKGTPPRLSEAQRLQPSQAAIQETRPEEEKPEVEVIRRSEKPDFADEYRYVREDLRRIGILAAAMLGGLIALYVII
jgi:hypothetical protein